MHYYRYIYPSSVNDILVNYVLRGGKLFNMVLLVPDDIPEESLATTVEGNVKEMCTLFDGWDARYVLHVSIDLFEYRTNGLYIVFKSFYVCVNLSTNGGFAFVTGSMTGRIPPKHG